VGYTVFLGKKNLRGDIFKEEEFERVIFFKKKNLRG